VLELIYETHSISEDNEHGIASGWLPGKLSARGRELAVELGRRHRDDDLAAVFVSDLQRAVETADIAFGGTCLPLRQDVRLRECNYGELNGSPVTVLAEHRRLHIDEPFPRGQSYRQVVAATADFLRDVVNEWDGRRVIVISHSANKWALDCLLHGADLERLVDAPFAWQEGWTYMVDPRTIPSF
jgi:broad specificity phosphatase PhoE